MGSHGIQLVIKLSFCLMALFVKGQVPKARDVNKNISYKRETKAQGGKGLCWIPMCCLTPAVK